MRLDRKRRRSLVPLLALGLLVYALPALADDTGAPVSTTTIQADLMSYYGGERASAYFVTAVGVLAVGAGAVLVTRGTDFSSGLGWSLVSIGALQGIGGVFYAFQVGAEIDHYQASLARDPVAYQKEELTHIHGTTSRFVFYRLAEAALALGGIGVAAYGFAAKQDVWKGVGIGVAGLAIPFFVMDSFNDARAERYEERVRRLDPHVSVQLGGADRPWAVTLRGAF